MQEAPSCHLAGLDSVSTMSAIRVLCDLLYCARGIVPQKVSKYAKSDAHLMRGSISERSTQAYSSKICIKQANDEKSGSCRPAVVQDRGHFASDYQRVY